MTTVGGTSGVVSPLSPLTTVSNFPILYLNGCRLTWASTTTFIVSSGQCRDASGLTDIIMGQDLYSYYNQSNEWVSSLPVAVTVNVNTVGAGGLDKGTLAASTFYYVYAVGDSKGFLPATVVFSLSAPIAGVNTGGTIPTSITLPVGPTLPTGIDSSGIVRQYDCFRYIGGISIDSSSHVRKFTQTGSLTIRTMWYDPGTGPSTTGITIPSSATSGSTSYANVGVLTTLIPQKEMEVLISASLTPNAAGDAIYLAPPTIDNGTTATIGSMANVSAEVTGHAQLGVLRVPADLPNATQQSSLTIGNVVTVLYATTSASDTVAFTLTGYVDQL